MLTTHTDKHVKIVTNYRNKTMINGRLCARKIMFFFYRCEKKRSDERLWNLVRSERERERERERGGGSRCKEKKVVCRRERNEKK